jgi:hypothetical protein
MRKFSYWLCFSLVAIPSGISIIGWLLSIIHVAIPSMGLLLVLSSFGSLIPKILAPMFPAFINAALALVMLLLVIRRAWLLMAKRDGVPHSFQGTAKVLAYVGAGSLMLGITVLLLSAVFRVASGALGGMLIFPAALCVPWAFFLTEVLSLRGAKGGQV